MTMVVIMAKLNAFLDWECSCPGRNEFRRKKSRNLPGSKDFEV